MMFQEDLEFVWSHIKEPKAPHVPREPRPKKDRSLLVLSLVAVVVVFGLLLAGIAIGRASGKRLAADAMIEKAAAEARAEQAKDAATYWQQEAVEASKTASALAIQLEDERQRAETYKEYAEEASSTIATLKQQKAAPKPQSTQAIQVSYNTSGVEQWRDLVTRWVTHYGGSEVNVEQFLSVMRKESGGNPTSVNKSSGCSGLMQIHPCHAEKYLSITSQPYYDGRFDPSANIQFAAYMSAGGRDWSSWSAKP